MSTKKRLNHPEAVVRELLDGIVAVSGRSALLKDENIVIQTGLSQQTKARSRSFPGVEAGTSRRMPVSVRVQAVCQLGLRVPEDFAILGIDGLP